VKRPEFENVLKSRQMFFQMLRFSCLLQEFKFTPKFLGYLTDHRWSALVISRKDDVSSGEGGISPL
jgi:hypothetical protein